MKTEKSNKLRGTVLFTVVAVMALLIIFLTGTLALATASSNRAHKSYSSSQASYTAKTAIEGFTEAMSRDADVAKTIKTLGQDSNPSKITPEVRINSGGNVDRSMGLIGHWDENGVWQSNKILIEKIGGTNEYAFDTDANSETYGKWIPVDMVKITATARVGKEESTVTAYIKKAKTEAKQPPKNNDSSGIKGFNTIGDGNFANGGRFTGGLGIGLKRNVPQDYVLHNAFEADTTLTFINGNVLAGTSTFALDCHQQSARPVQETVITGNLWVSNGQNAPLVELDYSMDSNYTQQQIPYLYVDGLFGFSSQVTLVNIKSGRDASKTYAPYNIFCGTFVANQNEYKGHSVDLYMMDPYTDDTDTYKDVATNHNGQGVINQKQTFIKGENYFGKDSGSNALYKWAENTLNPYNNTANQNESYGGSIYCNGNLYLAHINKIDGDVRVEGNCYIGMKNKTEAYGDNDAVNITGDLVVHGHLYVKNADQVKAARIFCDPDKIHVVNGSVSASTGGSGSETFKEVFNIEHMPEALRGVDLASVQEKEYPKRELFKWDPAVHKDASGHMLLLDGNIAEDTAALYYRWKEDYAPGMKIYQDKELKTFKYVYADETFEEEGYEEFGKLDEEIAKFLAAETFLREPVQIDIIDKFIDIGSAKHENELEVVDGNPKTWYRTNVEFIRVEEGVPVFRNKSVEVDRDKFYYVPGNDDDHKIVTELPYYTIADYDGETDTGTRTENFTTIYVERTGEDGQKIHEIVTKEYRDNYISQHSGATLTKDSITNANVYNYALYGKSAYPEKMKREAIYSAKGTPTKIIKTADEVREEMKLDDMDASYPDNVPTDLIPGSTVSYRDQCEANIAWNATNGKDDTCAVWAKDDAGNVTDTIVGNCTLQGTINKDITIAPKASETIWVILDNLTLSDNGCNIIVDLKNGKTVESGKVCFLIKKTLLLYGNNGIVNKRVIPTKNESNQDVYCQVTADDDWGIEFYGATDSLLILRNGCTITGTFRCPRTNIACNNSGKYKVLYTDEYGNDWSGKGGGQTRGDDPMQGKPPLIGNALFYNVLTQVTINGQVTDFGQNNFGMYYTSCGNGGGTGAGNKNGQQSSSITTPEGVFDIIYFSGV